MKLFEDDLKSNMIMNATYLIKGMFGEEGYEYIHDIPEYEKLCYCLDADESKTRIMGYFQDIALKYDFKLEFEFKDEKVVNFKWYYHGKRILPNNGKIRPLKPVKSNTTRSPIPPVLRHEVLLRDGYRCLECGASTEDRMLEIDHIVPVSQGGSDEMSNLQTLCILCNRAKSNRAWESQL